jgi:predicted ATPase
MAQVFEDVTEIDLYPYPDNTPGVLMVITHDGQQRPLYVFGDGMRRWFHLLGHMIVYKNSIHCIEEIDATFHPDAHQNLSRLLVKYAQMYQNQLFATSHSLEFLDAFEDEDPVRVFTILPGKPGGQPEIWSRTGREAHKDRRQYGMELRG